MMPVKGRLSLGSTRPFQPVAVDPARGIIVASSRISTVTSITGTNDVLCLLCL